MDHESAQRKNTPISPHQGGDRRALGGEISRGGLCVYTHNTQNFVENSKMGEKHKKNDFDPNPTFGSDLG